MKKLKWTGKELTAYHDGHVTGARKMFDAIHAAMMAIKKDRALEIVEEPAKNAPESAVTSTNKQSTPLQDSDKVCPHYDDCNYR